MHMVIYLPVSAAQVFGRKAVVLDSESFVRQLPSDLVLYICPGSLKTPPPSWFSCPHPPEKRNKLNAARY